MTPTKEQLEELANNHIDRLIDWRSNDHYDAVLAALDAYFNERLKMVAGEPVAWMWETVDVDSRTIEIGVLPKRDDFSNTVWTPLYSLEIKP